MILRNEFVCRPQDEGGLNVLHFSYKITHKVYL